MFQKAAHHLLDFQTIVRKNIGSFIEKHATDGKVLDIGVGTDPYAVHFPNRVTLDVNPAKKPDVVGDAHELPFENESFDCVVCTEVLEHLKEPRKAIQEMHRVLKAGGKVILTTRFIFPIHGAPNDYWRFTKYGLEELFSDDAWKDLAITAETRNFSTIGVLFQRIVFQTRMRANKLTKLFMLFFAWLFTKVNGLVAKEYGDIDRTRDEQDIMPSGYYIVASKK